MKSNLYFKMKNSKYLLAIGLLSVISGMYLIKYPERNFQSSSGFLVGIGIVFTVYSLIMLYMQSKLSDGELKNIKIENIDERNIKIEQAANSFTFKLLIPLFVMIVLILMLLDYFIPAIIVVGLMTVLLLVNGIAHSHYKNKI